MKKTNALMCFLLAGTLCFAQKAAKPVKASDSTYAKFVIAYNDSNQSSVISVQYGTKTIKIDSVGGQAQMLSRSDYKSKNVPGSALACCWSWWAGMAKYYYIAKVATGVAVYKGDEYEEGPNKAGDWKITKEISQ